MKDISLLTSELKIAISACGSNPIDRLSSIADILEKLSANPDKYNVYDKLAKYLDAEDVNTLRALIFDEVKKLKYLNAIEVTEQVLFVIIGALKLDTKQGGLADPWNLASKSIKSLLKRNNKSSNYKYALHGLLYLSIGVIIWMSIGNNNTHQTSQLNSIANYDELYPLAESVPSPYIPSHFYSLRAQMKKATCQFPQAAMLPAEQRVAFLKFINTGEIDFHELSNLQIALTRVHCEFSPLTSRLN